MRTIIKWLAVTLLLSAVLATALFVNVWFFKPVAIDAFYARMFAKFALERPEMLSGLRALPAWADFYSSTLDDASPAQDDRDAAATADNLATLRRYDRSALDREGRLSYDTLEYFLRSQAEGDTWRLAQFPVNQLGGIHTSLPNLMVQVHQVTSASEARDYVARLNAFLRKFDETLANMALREGRGFLPPRFAVDKALAQMQMFIAKPTRENLLYLDLKQKLDKLAPGAMDAATRDGLMAQAEAAITQSVLPAYRKLIDHMTALAHRALVNEGAWHLPDGDTYYAWCVRSHTTTDMTPAQVHALGLTEVARIGAEMDVILTTQGHSEGSIGSRLQVLAHEPSQLFPNTEDGRKAMLARFQAILDEVNAGLGAAFDVRPKLGVEVRRMPAFSEQGAPEAYYETGSIDGSRPGVFYVNLRDTALMAKFGMRTMAYHEGIPGHHFQGSIAQELEGVPFFRKIIPFTAYNEGWALYAERLAFELGFERDPLDNLGRLRDEMMRAVRLVVDTGIHAKHWTREQAVAYMIDKTGFDEASAVTEIERYFVDPGQALAYKVGMLKIMALREKARASLGEKFDLAQFHNQVLTHGALPLVVLEHVIDDWIAARKAGS